ncbi:serine-7 [Diaporthe helianthi]|uniref:Serine-7 n=1 Tax=Diaporthe helianthi TaxID=158607 RepID=A0A2P5I8G2_DIAHE|nr:serine-7 [Diaporthe helianthi]
MTSFGASPALLDYIFTGSWSLRAYQEAQRLLGPEHVNLVCDARTANGGNIRKVREPEHVEAVTGPIPKKVLLVTLPDKVDGQEAVANKKAALMYAAVEAHSQVNICFRVTKGEKVTVAPRQRS